MCDPDIEDVKQDITAFCCVHRNGENVETKGLRKKKKNENTVYEKLITENKKLCIFIWATN